MIKNIAGTVLLAASLIFFVGGASATDISGTITSTLTITADSKLVGNVTCTMTGSPCIKFGANKITLKLDGFIMTGKASANFGCRGGGIVVGVAGEDGVDTNGNNNVRIQGPGIIRRFKDNGIFLNGGTLDEVEHVTLSTNCHNGIQVSSTQSIIEENVSVRNGSINTASCGGIGVTGNNNLIRENEVGGNGVSDPQTIDFGIGVFGQDNVIEGNGITGNTRLGIFVPLGATGNTVRRNIVMGNPAIQSTISTFAALTDILDNNAAGANTYFKNLCEVSSGGAAAACPNIPGFAGHEND